MRGLRFSRNLRRLRWSWKVSPLLVGLIFVGVSLWPVVVGSASASMTTVLFTAVGLGLIAWGLRPAVARMRLGPPDMSISSTRLRVGEEFSVSYGQTWKRATDVNRVLFQLVLRETVRFTQGTETVTETHDKVVQQFELPGRHFGPGEMIKEHLAFRISEPEMHTFTPSDDNRIQWFVKVSVEMAKWPDFTQEYEITVLPEMAR
jgi:hypothetical protein